MAEQRPAVSATEQPGIIVLKIQQLSMLLSLAGRIAVSLLLELGVNSARGALRPLIWSSIAASIFGSYGRLGALSSIDIVSGWSATRKFGDILPVSR
jgi:hypothetical protein